MHIKRNPQHASLTIEIKCKFPLFQIGIKNDKKIKIETFSDILQDYNAGITRKKTLKINKNGKVVVSKNRYILKDSLFIEFLNVVRKNVSTMNRERVVVAFFIIN